MKKNYDALMSGSELARNDRLAVKEVVLWVIPMKDRVPGSSDLR
jgi:hypothetical protein